jgi:hypothetical protein
MIYKPKNSEVILVAMGIVLKGYIGTLFKVWFIHESSLFRVWLRLVH